jgi:hypothetical protein
MLCTAYGLPILRNRTRSRRAESVLPILSHPLAVALHFARRTQLTAGFARAGMRQRWARNGKGVTD